MLIVLQQTDTRDFSDEDNLLTRMLFSFSRITEHLFLAGHWPQEIILKRREATKKGAIMR